MKGWEMMIVNMLKGMGFDPDAIMADVQGKVAYFQQGFDAMNVTLVTIQQSQQRQEAMLRALCEAQNIAVPEASNVTILPPLERRA